MARTQALMLQIATGDPRPISKQIVDGVRRAVATGELAPGAQLPSVRGLATQLSINPNTVAKAYAELESQGVIETIAGKGCFVRAGESPLRKDVRRRLVSERIDDAVIHAHHLQIDKPDFIRLAEERFDALDRKRAANA